MLTDLKARQAKPREEDYKLADARQVARAKQMIALQEGRIRTFNETLW